MIFKTTSSAFGNLIEDDDLDFADVTLVCEDGHQVEAHKPKDFIFGRWKTKVRGRHLRHHFDEKLGTKS